MRYILIFVTLLCANTVPLVVRTKNHDDLSQKSLSACISISSMLRGRDSSEVKNLALQDFWLPTKIWYEKSFNNSLCCQKESHKKLKWISKNAEIAISMIYSKPLFAAFLLAFATSCEAEYHTRQSRMVRGSTDEETSRLLKPSNRGKGGGSGKGGKSNKVFSFTNPKKGEEVCALKETTFLIDGTSTAIPSANAAPLPAGYSFLDCNDLLSLKCRGIVPVLDQAKCLFPTPTTVVSDFTKSSDFYKCLEGKGVINGPWFFHRDTPGSEFRFTTAKMKLMEAPAASVPKSPIPTDSPQKPKLSFLARSSLKQSCLTLFHSRWTTSL